MIDDGSLIFNHADSITFTASINGNGTVTQSGTGTLILTGSNTYTGGTFVENGTLIVVSPCALPSGGELIVGSGAASLFANDSASTGIASTVSGGLPVPEPSGTCLLGFSAAGLLVFWIRKAKRTLAAIPLSLRAGHPPKEQDRARLHVANGEEKRPVGAESRHEGDADRAAAAAAMAMPPWRPPPRFPSR